MDRYVLVVSFHQEENKHPNGSKALEAAKQVYVKLGDISCCNSTTRCSSLPACSLSGSPAAQRWYFAVQACQGTSQFCSAEWEELGVGSQRSESDEECPSALEACLSALGEQGGQSDQADPQALTELYEEAAEGLHLLSDKLPPPGKALLDVLFLGVDEEAPSLKDFLPVIGSLKHMQAWHSAKMTIVTEHSAGWQKPASYLSASIVDPSCIVTCIDERELWRGGLLIREKKFVSDVKFEGFTLRSQGREPWGSVLPTDASTQTSSDQKLHSEVFHYYCPVLDLVQLVTVADLPSFLHSSTEFDLALSTKSVKAKLLLDQLRPLCGKVGALFSLSCVVSTMALPPASQLSSQKWKEFLAKRPKALPVPDVEVKGESSHYFLLVQGSDSGGCKARMIHSANQINGAAALATVHGLLKEKSLSSSGTSSADWLRSLPCLRGEQLLQRERRLMKVQTLVLKECLKRRVEAQKPACVPVNDLKVLLSLAREQYLRMHDSTLPNAALCVQDEKENHTTTKASELRQRSQTAEWPERSVLQNFENLQRSRQKLRIGLMSGTGSSDCLLGPKDGQRVTPALLDAKELLRHFTPEGLPSGELQPLHIQRGGNGFQLSPDLTPRKVTQLPFNKASSSHYHGIEFCLDEQNALDRDRGFVKLQSRLIRYETQTTCSKEPCPIPFALSPAPSPAMLSEPGSVPDGEALQNTDGPRLKRRSWETDAVYPPHKRLAKSESSESLGSQCSGSSGTHKAVRALRQQPSRSQSTSSALRQTPAVPLDPRHTQKPPQGQTEDTASKESRSQKHHRMLKEVVAKTLKHHGITSEHKCFDGCSQRLFEISKFYLKDLKTSRGLHEEMKKAASSNAKQVIDWVVERASKK